MKKYFFTKYYTSNVTYVVSLIEFGIPGDRNRMCDIFLEKSPFLMFLSMFWGKFGEWKLYSLYGLNENVNSDVSKHYIHLNHNLIKSILHILSIYSFNSQNFQNLSYQKLWMIVLYNLIRQNFKILKIEWMRKLRRPC